MAGSLETAYRHRRPNPDFVLFDGVWCDVSFWSGDATDSPAMEAPGYPEEMSLDDYANVLDTFIALFG